ncbi:polyprenyl synthetase family protein [bacterium]|nr:polyprenyl synthetase family protein [bacterium]
MKIRDRLERERRVVNDWLGDCLPEPEELSRPVFDAMSYSLLAGGKRLRPILMVSTSRLFRDGVSPLLRNFACGMECIHTYSLIHDDLPSMDDDDLRRGRPTSHKVFGEAIAILAGDALLTLAFELMSRPALGDEKRQLKALNSIAVYAGSLGMVGGQIADIREAQDDDMAESIRFIHKRKTGALIRASVEAGAVLAGASDEECETLSEFGGKIGFAFQIVDDLLEHLGDSDVLGKNTDSDARNQRLTYPGVMGVERAKDESRDLICDAISLLEPYGKDGEMLKGIARYFVERVS